MALSVPRQGQSPTAWPGANGNSEESPTQSRRFDPLVTLGVILGSGFLVVLLTAGLLFLCLHGDEPNTNQAVNSADPDDSPFLPAPLTPRPLPPKKTLPAVKSLIELTAEENQKVHSATQRGLAYLKSKQITNGPHSGSWQDRTTNCPVGYTALAGLTLLECHVPPQDPAIQEAAGYVRRRGWDELPSNETYQVSLAILFLCRLDDKADYQLIRSLALRLVESQHTSGGWSYPSPPLDPQNPANRETKETELLAHLKRFSNTTAVYVARGLKSPAYDLADNSNTQFAVLALWAARRYDLPLDPVLGLVVQRFRNTQMADGSWEYQTGRVVTPEHPTMTAAGLLGLAVGYGLNNDAKVGASMVNDEVLQKGLRRLAQGVGHPGGFKGEPPPTHTYFLWSVERVAVLYQLPKIDGKDWYRWGLEILKAYQRSDGRFEAGVGHASSDIVDTCFALLFLQRANLAKDLTDKIQQLLEAMGQLQQKE